MVGSWEPRATLPAARQETGVAELGGLIYVVGGFDAQTNVVTTVEAYDPMANTWQGRAPLPEPLHHVNLAVADGKLLVLGGLRGGQFAATGVAYAYDPGTDAWTPLRAMPSGSERGGAAVAPVDGMVIIAGGLRGGPVAEVSAYHVASDTWEMLPALPAARDHLVGAVVAGKFLAIGGRRGGQLDGRVDVFDPVSRVWTQGAPMPTARAGCAAAVLDGRVYVAGGEGNAADPDGMFRDMESYDPVADGWVIHEPMRTPRHGTGAASWNGMVFVPGGADVQGFAAVATHEAFAP